jgi:hypothetical protein
VYLETFRSRRLLNEAEIEPLKKFFTDHGVEVSGGLTLASNDSGQFQTFSFVNEDDRALVKLVSETAARHFDQIILDDFFFYCTKTDADIVAKGDKSWTQFRLETMREASENLVVKPMKAVNPRAKVVIKYPNWYEHFQGLGYDLDIQPKIFDGIYTGTETRDPVATEQHLQPYESYQIVRYFENIAPGRNGGGWVDGYQYRIVDRYAEQLWDTAFAKPQEITLFNFGQILEQVRPGDRTSWEKEHTSLDYAEVTKRANGEQPRLATVAGYALEQVDHVVHQLGKPIGVKSYRPPQATGEDFLHNFLGMTGVPIDLYPTFPADASTILLTEAAKDDPEVVGKIRQQLQAGKNVVVTSGLVRALQDKGLQGICETEVTERRIAVTEFHGQGGAPLADSKMAAPILFPELKFKTNDAWFVLAGLANGNGYPLMISDRYSKGVLYVMVVPDNPADLYAMPASALNLMRNILTRDLPVRMEGPAQVSLFEYDNNTCVLQNFAAIPLTVTVFANVTNAKQLRDLASGELLPLQPPALGRGFGRGGRGMNNPNYIAPKPGVAMTLPPHSYRGFAVE